MSLWTQNVNSNDAGKSSMSSIDKSMNVGIVVVLYYRFQNKL